MDALCIPPLDRWYSRMHSGDVQTNARARPTDDVEDLIERALEELLTEARPLVRYEALTRAQTVFEAMAGRIAEERARAVGEMHSSGLSYAQIAEAIGFTRSRAQQLVERSAVQARPTVKEASAVTRGGLAGYLAAHATELLASSTTVPELSGQLLADSEFRVLQLGTLARRQKREAWIAAVKDSGLDLSAAQETMLIAAVEDAAQLQRKAELDKAVAGGLLIAAGAALLLSGKK